MSADDFFDDLEKEQRLRAELSRLRAENERLTERCAAYKGQVQAGSVRVEAADERITELEGERDTATRALEAIGSLAVMSEGNVAGGVVSSREVDAIINAALSKTEGKG